MFELDGSETSWLIYCDWLEDHDCDNSFVKFGLDELQTNQFCYEYTIYTVGSGSTDGTVGGYCIGYIGSGNVGADFGGVGSRRA